MMRCSCLKAPVAGLLLLLAAPPVVRAQGVRYGMFVPTQATLLRDDKVLEELKMTSEQKAQVKTITDKYKDDLEKARAAKDGNKLRELRKARREELIKAIPDLLKPEQSKRLDQLVLQADGLNAFAVDAVQAALKLTGEQKTDIEAARDEANKKVEDLFKDVEDDSARAEALKKAIAVRNATMDKLINGLTDDQKKEWKALTGDMFEFSFPMARPRSEEKPKGDK